MGGGASGSPLRGLGGGECCPCNTPTPTLGVTDAIDVSSSLGSDGSGPGRLDFQLSQVGLVCLFRLIAFLFQLLVSLVFLFIVPNDGFL